MSSADATTSFGQSFTSPLATKLLRLVAGTMGANFSRLSKLGSPKRTTPGATIPPIIGGSPGKLGKMTLPGLLLRDRWSTLPKRR